MGHQSHGYFRCLLMTWEMVQLARQVSKLCDQGEIERILPKETRKAGGAQNISLKFHNCFCRQGLTLRGNGPKWALCRSKGLTALLINVSFLNHLSAVVSCFWNTHFFPPCFSFFKCLKLNVVEKGLFFIARELGGRGPFVWTLCFSKPVSRC